MIKAYDKTEVIGQSIINHGNFNDRIYLMKLNENDLPNIIDYLNNLAFDSNYTKIIAKVPFEYKEIFIKDGYIKEALIPKFFNGKSNVLFMSKFLSQERMMDIQLEKCKKIRNTALLKRKDKKHVKLLDNFTFNACDEDDAEEMAELFNKVFETYPVPIYNKDYLIKTMNENTIYFCIRNSKRIVSIASCEMDIKSQNVEMTSFATLPSFRGNSFSYYLLKRMEAEMVRLNFKTAYATARSQSFGMNITFSRSDYNYGGLLINNNNISGDLESMNVWYKQLIKY